MGVNTAKFIQSKQEWIKFCKEKNIKSLQDYYILCEKYGYHIFDLVKTSKLLRLAGNVVEKKAAKGGKFLFVGTNRLSAPCQDKTF
jgi:ribosomal protein S2